MSLMSRRDVRWWEDTDRVCRNDERYLDLRLIVPDSRRYGLGGRKVQIENMVQGCLRCPVYYECLADLLRVPRYMHYGVRAAIVGKV